LGNLFYLKMVLMCSRMAEREEEGREGEGREGDMDSKREGPDEDHTEVVFFSQYQLSSEVCQGSCQSKSNCQKDSTTV
jgi:hypothetical protein